MEHLIAFLINTDFRLGSSSTQELVETHLEVVVHTTVTILTEAPHMMEEMGTIGDLQDHPTLEPHRHQETPLVEGAMMVLAHADLHLVVDANE